MRLPRASGRLARPVSRLCGSVALLICTSVTAAPLPARDQNPLLAGFGLPPPLPAQLAPSGSTSVGVELEWGSTALIQAERDELLIVDAETREARLVVSRSLSERHALRVEIPYRYTGAGTLDAFIDSWHDFFSLPEGARRRLPRDELRIAYAREGRWLLDGRTTRQGLGDVSIHLARTLATSTTTDATLWLGLELPSGDEDDFTGNGAIDASLALAAAHAFHPRGSIFGQAAIAWLGEGDFLREQQRSIAWSALAGLSWRAWGGLEFKIQAEAHSSPFEDSSLDFLSDALVLSVGGSYLFSSKWQLDLAVTEDIAVETAPDVVFLIALQRRH